VRCEEIVDAARLMTTRVRHSSPIDVLEAAHRLSPTLAGWIADLTEHSTALDQGCGVLTVVQRLDVGCVTPIGVAARGPEWLPAFSAMVSGSASERMLAELRRRLIFAGSLRSIFADMPRPDFERFFDMVAAFGVQDIWGLAAQDGGGALLSITWPAAHRGASDDDKAMDLWQALVSGRWTLTDVEDSDGKRLVMAFPAPLDFESPWRLTEREASIVRWVLDGAQNKEIAYAMGIATSTVSSHLVGAMRKLRVRNRAELKVLAVRTLKLEATGAHQLSSELATTELDGALQAQLTRTQRELLAHLAAGRTNAEIAALRQTSVLTVRNLVQRLMHKLGAGATGGRIRLRTKRNASGRGGRCDCAETSGTSCVARLPALPRDTLSCHRRLAERPIAGSGLGWKPQDARDLRMTR